MKTVYHYDELDHTVEFISQDTPEILTRVDFAYSQSDESALEVVRALNRGETSISALMAYGDEVIRIDTATTFAFASGTAHFTPPEDE